MSDVIYTSQESIKITCPNCGNKMKRQPAMLELFITGCPECLCTWKHELMVYKEHREKKN